jgi:hypothetical protein
MGVKQLPSTHNYWNEDAPVLHCEVILNVMSCRRREAILRCLHLVDTSLVQRTNKYWKPKKVSKRGSRGRSSTVPDEDGRETRGAVDNAFFDGDAAGHDGGSGCSGK